MPRKTRLNYSSSTSPVLLLLALTIILSACVGAAPQAVPTADRAELGRHYRLYHDYESLVALIPTLDTYRMTRADVEGLLGEPTFCPVQDKCLYSTGRMISASCPEGSLPGDNICRVESTGKEIPPLRFALMLAVNYEPGNLGASARLIGFFLTPVGE
jgi:hypothetical protein